MGNGADDRLNAQTQYAAQSATEFPRYLIKIGKEMKFLSMQQAGIALDNDWARVECLTIVLMDDFSARRITPEEQNRMQEIADRNSASK